jgi:lipopolysaccharide transport system ATP-binding protein
VVARIAALMLAPGLAISARGLGKRYRLGERARYKALRDSIATLATGALRRRTPPEHVWALRDLSFDVAQGESLGIIGRNGAGKSTLLKLLSRITEPTEGEALIRGRVGSLLEVGSGFHPELTGRENVFLNGAILGMHRAEIRRKFDEIVAFAGVERFIDTPVKRYSTGMYLRLAFAVAAHLETEILLVDEVLAVGDAAFQVKGLERMSRVAGEGRTVLFVSHNLESVARLCPRSILLTNGHADVIAPTTECIDRYLSSLRQAPVTTSLRSHPGRTKSFDGPVRLTRLTLVDVDGRPSSSFECGGPFEARIEFELQAGGPHEAGFFVIFSTAMDQRISTCRSQDVASPARIDSSGETRCFIQRLPLVPGLYKLAVGAVTEMGHSDVVYDAAAFEVSGARFYSTGGLPPKEQGSVLFDHEWDAVAPRSSA